jgi:hypothetical protein
MVGILVSGKAIIPAQQGRVVAMGHTALSALTVRWKYAVLRVVVEEPESNFKGNLFFGFL